jgi:chromate transporter
MNDSLDSGATRVAPEDSARAAKLRELARLFLRLGTTAMGGPAAHIAMMEDEVVRRRNWVTREHFLDMLGAVNLIPGPNSTEMALHIGEQQAGWMGLIVAGTCFIVPAFLIVLAVAWAYVRFGAVPTARGLLYGVKPVIIAVVLQALWGLGKTAIRSRILGVLAVVTVVAAMLDVNDLVVLIGGGVVMVAIKLAMECGGIRALVPWPALAPAAMVSSVAGAATAFSLTTLFLFFLKVGAVLFGSGYVLLAFIRTDLVDRLHWMTNSQLLDAVAVGQITPGPVFTTATFIGYMLGGVRGAIVATIGIFLPSFVFVSISGPLIPKLRRSPIAGAFLDGVNVSAWALMVAVTYYLGRDAIVDVVTIVLAAASAVALLRYRVNSAWLVIAGGIIGIALGPWLSR